MFRMLPRLVAFVTGLVGIVELATSVSRGATPELPNIVVILADDLGYGDVQCYNPERGKIPTPHIDRLASQGMRFTDAHTSSGVCSPTRYALLTGRYHWRSRLQAGIVGYLERPLVDANRLTLAGLLKRRGYTTAAIGKWHLGWDWEIDPAQRPLFAPGRDGPLQVNDAHRAAWSERFAKPIGGGPITRGFDQYFGTDVPNWPPYCFIENDRTVGIPSQFLAARLLGNNQASIPGPALADWKLEPILPTLIDRACRHIEQAASKPSPFFLYLPLTTPHTPLAVNDDWKGKSGLNAYADLVMETDAMVGRVLAAIDAAGVADRTLVVFTSDNGCAPYVGAKDLEAKGHFPSGPLRGYKADAWEGGHRVPFIVRWPGQVRPSTRCDQLISQADLMATFAEIVAEKLPDDAGEDSFSLLGLWRGVDRPVRQYAVSCASSGIPAVRDGAWKLILGGGGGGFGAATPAAKGKAAPNKAKQPPAPDGTVQKNTARKNVAQKNVSRKNAAQEKAAPQNAAEPSIASVQLYDLSTDLGETKNVASEHPDQVAAMIAVMEKLVEDGRSSPGAKQANDVPVRWRRFLAPAAQASPAAQDSPAATKN